MSFLDRLSRREREVIEILFRLGRGTVSAISAAMKEPPTRPALRSIIVSLADKGHLQASGKHGREIVYEPRDQPDTAGRSAFQKMLATFFGGSLRDGVAACLADPECPPSPSELDEIEALIRDAKTRRQRP